MFFLILTWPFFLVNFLDNSKFYKKIYFYYFQNYSLSEPKTLMILVVRVVIMSENARKHNNLLSDP